MKYKLLRALCYLKELLAMLLCKLLGAVCRAFSPAYRGIWLVGERGTDARDNGYWFYRYLRTQHPELRTYYVITADSPDAAKIAALGGAVQRCSFRHYLLYYCADYLVGTHVQPCAPDLIVHYHLAAKGIRARGKQVFLQHGVTMSEMQWMHRENLYLDLFVCGAKPEYEYIRDTYGFAPEVTRYLGFARWDHLLQAGQAPCKKMILLMPTWRGSHYPEGEAFLDTPYYKAFDSLLSSARLDALLEQYGYTLVFYPHIEMQKHLSRFHAPSERVVLADSAMYDVQQLLLDCALLVTDHSSVFFDVAYLEKPELYYQFDEEDYQRYHYQKGILILHGTALARCAPPRTRFCRCWKRLCRTGCICRRNTRPGLRLFSLCAIPKTAPAPTKPSAGCDWRKRTVCAKIPPLPSRQRGDLLPI